MWNFIKGILQSGIIMKKFFKTVWYLFLGLLLISIILVYKPIWITAAIIFTPPLFERLLSYLHGKYLDIETVPYWGQKFGFKQTIKLLAEDKFHPYKFRNGKVCRKLKVSESGRWFMVAGRYYPIYLVKRFIQRNNQILMIDGALLESQSWLDNKDVVAALEEIFTDKGVYSNSVDAIVEKNDCKIAFSRVCGNDYKALGKADWDEVRLLLEKELKELQAGHANSRKKKKHMRDIISPESAKNTMYSRVLTDEEIQAISAAIKVGMILNLNGWFEKSNFKNDLFICNGVSILKAIGYPLNKVGENFLFECITDINKPYFEDAVTTLAQFPRENLIKLIEKHVSRAYEKHDVLFGAGLIYLAGKIDYEISLAKENDASDQDKAVAFAGDETVLTSGGSAAAVQFKREAKE